MPPRPPLLVQTNLEIAPASASGFHARSSLAGSGKPGSDSASPAKSKGDSSAASPPTTVDATKAYLEQVRLTILGMEQRMQSREEKLAKHIERAEAEGARFEEVRRQALSTTSS